MKSCLILFIAIALSQEILFSQAGWYQVQSGTTNDLNFVSPFGVIVGNNGIVLKSSDTSFYPVSAGTIRNLNSVVTVPAGTPDLFISVGDGGIVIRSSNYGTNWTVIQTQFNNDLISVYSNEDTLWAAGKNGLIIKSTNHGNNWLQSNSGTNIDLNFINGSYQPGFDSLLLICIGNSGTVLISTNFGGSWINRNIPVQANLYGLTFGIFEWYVCGSDGAVFSTTNNGLNWNSRNTGLASSVRSIYYSSSTGYCNATLLIACDNGIIMSSSNSGISWNYELSNTSVNLKSIFGYGCREGISAGLGGLIITSMLNLGQISRMNILPNQISTWIRNDGSVNTNRDISNENGFVWPKNTNKNAISTAGLWLGAKINDSLRLALSFNDYQNEFYPGYLDFASQVPHGKNDHLYRIYKVNPLFPNGGNGYDSWSLWPVYQGAPWIDLNHNGHYDPPEDTPIMKGDENTFCAYTDAYPESHRNYAGSTLPLNADVHLYCYAVSNPQCADAFYMEWTIINKKNVQWDSMFAALWADPDLGDPTNDKTGCDTNLNIGFNYNYNDDFVYGNLYPAFGYGIYEASRHTNRLMDIFNDPKKNYYEPATSLQAWSILRGRKKNDSLWYNPISNQPSTLLYSGDPESGTGWLYRNRYGTATGDDTRMLLGSYFGTVNPQDTIRFYTVAFIKSGLNNLNAVTQLKNCYHQGVIGLNSIQTNIPEKISLSQNYPNPFNPTTKIKFSIPSSRGLKEKYLVKLTIYDVLGREIITLVNEQLNPGAYETEWDGTNSPSGVYFYRLESDQYSQTRKLVLIK